MAQRAGGREAPRRIPSSVAARERPGPASRPRLDAGTGPGRQGVHDRRRRQAGRRPARTRTGLARRTTPGVRTGPSRHFIGPGAAGSLRRAQGPHVHRGDLTSRSLRETRGHTVAVLLRRAGRLPPPWVTAPGITPPRPSCAGSAASCPSTLPRRTPGTPPSRRAPRGPAGVTGRGTRAASRAGMTARDRNHKRSEGGPRTPSSRADASARATGSGGAARDLTPALSSRAVYGQEENHSSPAPVRERGPAGGSSPPAPARDPLASVPCDGAGIPRPGRSAVRSA